MRARDLGVVVGTGVPGTQNAISDVEGVLVGHVTLISGSGPLVVGEGPVRTGVTVIVPAPDVWVHPVFAGVHRLNGNGELTGSHAIAEFGLLSSPIALTTTHSIGAAHEGLVRAEVAARPPDDAFFGLPVVAETWDGVLNDANGFHVRPEHALEALRVAASGRVAEGNVGGGTGMISFGFKAGIGTASRVVPELEATVGVLVQSNFGARERLTINGVPVGRQVTASEVPVPHPSVGIRPAGAGSIIGIVATDAPLLPHQCTRLAQRMSLGVARLGSVAAHSSGDLFLAFSTGNRTIPGSELRRAAPREHTVAMVPDVLATTLFEAVVEATEEAVVNALLGAETMIGRDGVTAHALDRGRLVTLLDAYGRRDARDLQTSDGAASGADNGVPT